MEITPVSSTINYIQILFQEAIFLLTSEAALIFEKHRLARHSVIDAGMVSDQGNQLESLWYENRQIKILSLSNKFSIKYFPRFFSVESVHCQTWVRLTAELTVVSATRLVYPRVDFQNSGFFSILGYGIINVYKNIYKY